MSLVVAERVALVVEDRDELRLAIAAMLRDHGFTTVLEAADLASGKRFVGLARSLELALVDLGLPDGSGVDLVRQIADTRPATSVVVVTIFDDDAHLFAALSAGANGYLLKDSPPDAWRAQLRALEDGMPALSPSIARRVLAYFRGRPTTTESTEVLLDEPLIALTARETDVLGLIGRGLRVNEAASTLGLAESTVAGYVKDIYRKLSISTRAEAALEAARRGLT